MSTSLPGVVGVFVAADLGLKPRAAFPAPDSMARPPLAERGVRVVGDIVAVAGADSRAHAVDAAAAVVLDYEPLPGGVCRAGALTKGATVRRPGHGETVVC